MAITSIDALYRQTLQKLQDQSDPTQVADDALRSAFASGDEAAVKQALQADVDAYVKQYGDDGEKGAFNDYQDHLDWVAGGSIPEGLKDEVSQTLASSEKLNSSVSSAVWGADLGDVEWKDTGMNLFPSGTPTSSDVHQHGIGDCDVDSALAAWAQSDPAGLMSHITQSGSGEDATYAVKMVDPSGNDISIEVDGKSLVDASGGMVSGGNADGSANWTTVMEKAMAKYDDIYGIGAIGGQGSEAAIRAFTGSSNTFAVAAGDATAQDVSSYVQAGNVVTGGFSQDMTLPNGDQVVSGHGYAVLGITTDADGNQTVQMRNPWGTTPTANGYDDSKDGVVDVPLNVFQQYCDLRVIGLDASGAGFTSPSTESSSTQAADLTNSEDVERLQQSIDAGSTSDASQSLEEALKSFQLQMVAG